MDNPNELADRYAAIWNEPDAERRRQAVTELWTEDAVHILQPPQEVQDAAASLDVTATFRARGHGELEARVRRAYEEFVAGGGNSFRPQEDLARLGDVVKFRWEMITSSGDVAGVGLEFVVLDADGRIKTDYQFIKASSVPCSHCAAPPSAAVRGATYAWSSREAAAKGGVQSRSRV
jgi:hypothetical protein